MQITTGVTANKARIRNSLPQWSEQLGADAELFRSFVENTLNRIRGPYLAQHHPAEVLRALHQALLFSMNREAGQVKVVLRPRATKGFTVFTGMVDQPFIVDTVRLFLRRGEADYVSGINLVFPAVRDEAGHLVSIGEGEGAVMESVVMLEADGGSLLDDVAQSEGVLRGNLEFARAMVQDFGEQLELVERYTAKFERLAVSRPDQADALRETAAFLNWLLSENFVFMGIDTGDTHLGIQRLHAFQGASDGHWPEAHMGSTVRVRKSHQESPVHRSGRIDELLISVPRTGADDQYLFIRGMFTYRAITQASRNVPILRQVLANILQSQSAAPGSFQYKGIANVFDSLPTEYLFTSGVTAIHEMVDLVFDSEQQQDASVHVQMTSNDTAFVLVALPKGQFSDDLRADFEVDITGTLKATYSDHGLFVGRFDIVLMHYFLTGVVHPGDDQLHELKERLRQRATPWNARLWQALAEQYPESVADRLVETYANGFPKAWVRAASTDRLLRDVDRLESLSPSRPVAADLWADDDSSSLLLRIYQAEDLYLTQLMPVLNNFGLTVIDSQAVDVKARGGTLHIDDFRIYHEGIDNHTLLQRAPVLLEAMEAILSRRVSDTDLNALVISAGLTWEEVDVVRGLIGYFHQINRKVSKRRAAEILTQHPEMCARLVDFFHAKHDPDRDQDRKKDMKVARDRVEDELRKILTHDADLVFSVLTNLLDASLRTNFYRTDRKEHYLSFKFSSRDIKDIGALPPKYEIYVHHREVEGIHLRFGPVARGGLRWSDRDDYRTEILGLVTTQQVKNVVIVPVGSKGGFYLKHADPDWGKRRAQADHFYKTFIRGLLDLTDNRTPDGIVPPPRVVRHDGDDPYLVVAADKGTAHLSDTANGISRDYGFWLDDAFASGGSNGYDHKAVGITARGGWVLARRHFAEMGIDPYSEEFTVIGVGDMGGDVFGNGLIETPHARLLAAFNHLHIFLDPDPDTAASYAERKRLFEAGRGGEWANYDKSIISEGGGVFSRTVKSVPLSPQAQEMLGLEADEADPDTVIHHILQMQVDLLWNGGIGTYIKASFETDADADDRSNDELRVDANQLRCKIIGEGGNLGLTQKGRVEADLCGVRLNTDFIDNSGGVDMSDHEVNLKVLLGPIVTRGDLDQDARNVLLEEMTEEVAGLVLANNDTHGRQLSRDQVRSKQDIWQFARAISFIETRLGVDRRDLSLPSNKVLAKRAAEGQGMTRPELALISSWVKMYVFNELVGGKPRELPGFLETLRTYFPERVQAEYGDDIVNHMLADEIACTVFTTRIVGDAGAAFFPTMLETTGRSVSEVATAYLRAQRLAGVDAVRATLEQLRATVGLSALYGAWVTVDHGARSLVGLWLSAGGRVPSDAEVDGMAEAVDQVYAMQASEVLTHNRELIDRLTGEGLPRDSAQRVLKARYLVAATLVAEEATTSKRALEEVVLQQLAVGRASRLEEVIRDLGTRSAEGRWDPIALHILQTRFTAMLKRLTAAVDFSSQKDKSVDTLAPALAKGQLAEVRKQVDELLGAGAQVSVATLLVLEERLAAALLRI